tara:strand:- start:4285 stop:4515 length:231 start_codon:yes stop_codon:yes gene_type:complete
MEFVYLEWTDSAGSDGAWTDDKLELARIKSIGIKVKETKRAITLAQSKDDNRPPKWDNLLVIPKSTITKRCLMGMI